MVDISRGSVVALHSLRALYTYHSTLHNSAIVAGQMEKGGREEVGLVTGSLRKKLVNFYVDAVDGYDDTTA